MPGTHTFLRTPFAAYGYADREETAQELRRVEVERDKLAELVAVLRNQVQESEQHKDHVGERRTGPLVATEAHRRILAFSDALHDVWFGIQTDGTLPW